MRRANRLAILGLACCAMGIVPTSVYATTYVFDGFSAGGSGVVTASSGPGQGIPEAPLVGSAAHLGVQINLFDNGPEIPLDATGSFVFGPSDGFIVANIFVEGGPFGWAAYFQPGTAVINLNLDHGSVTNLAFDIFTPTGSPRGIQADTATGTFAVQFTTPLYSYDFSGAGYSLSDVPVFSRPAIPEPSQWSLLIVGFGILGALLRRRTRALATRFS